MERGELLKQIQQLEERDIERERAGERARAAVEAREAQVLSLLALLVQRRSFYLLTGTKVLILLA